MGVKERLTAEQAPAMGRWGSGLMSSCPGGEEAGLHPPTPVHRPSLARTASRSAPDLTCMAKRKQLGGEGQSPQREIPAPPPLEMHPQSEEQGTASCDGSPGCAWPTSEQGPLNTRCVGSSHRAVRGACGASLLHSTDKETEAFVRSDSW